MCLWCSGIVRGVVGRVVHGGDIEAVALRYGVSPENLIDFSANIDSHGPPPGVAEILAEAAKNPRLLSAYPSSTLYASARASIAEAVGVDSDGIVIGPGGAALIDLAIRCIAADTITVPIPAFSEYARAIAACGKTMHELELPPDFQLDAHAAAVSDGSALLVNTPHNPSGATLARRDMEGVLAACEETSREFIVDEAFIDYVPEQGIAASAQDSQRALVIRSLTKFYGLAGLRVGYLVTHPAKAAKLRATLPSWPVGTMELEIARACVEDRAYAERTRARVARDRAELGASLRSIGITVYPSAANFLLLELPCPLERFDDILQALVQRRGIVVRDCRTYRGLEMRPLIRAAVLSRESNKRLCNALREML